MTTKRELNLPIDARDDHHCFGCGACNPSGLHLRFFRSERGVWAPFRPDQRQEGYAGIVHGGIITTVLDEVMAWSLYAEEIWAVTARMNLTFRKPVEVGMPTRALGWVVADRGRIVEVASDLRREGDDALLASATASFVRVPAEQAEAWKARYLTSSEKSE